MALPKQNIPINFGKGLETKTDPFQIEIGKFLRLENTVFNRAPRLQKRNGYEALPTDIYNSQSITNSILGSDVTEGRLVTKFNDELVIQDPFNLYSFSESEQAWVYKGRSTVVGVGQDAVSTSLNGQTMSDSASNSTLGQSLFAWSDPELGIVYSIIDNETKQAIVSQAVASSTGLRARCLSVGSALILLYLQSNDLYGIRIDSSGATAPVSLITDINTSNPNYDADVQGSGIYVSYNGDSSNVKVAIFSGSLTLTASVSKSEDATSCIGNFFDTSGNVWTVYGNASEVKAFVMDSLLSVTVLAPTVVDNSADAQGVYNITGTFAQGKAFIFYDKPGIPSPGTVVSVREEGSNFSYVQPAVNATVTVNFPDASTDLIGDIVYVLGEKTSYYRITAAVANTSYTILNLGYSVNEAPGTTMNAFNASPFYQMLMYETNATTSYITVNTLTSAGVVGTPVEFARSVALGSKAFTMSDIPHLMGIHESSLQPTYFLLNLYNTILDPTELLYANIAAKVVASEGGSVPELPLLPRVNVSGSEAQLSLQKRNIFFQSRTPNANTILQPITNTYSLTGVVSVSLDFSLQNPKTQVLGEGLHIANGELVMYDGVNVVEHGFHLFPEGITASVSTSGGGMAAGTYGYQVVYEWRDNKGQVHRSAPSPNVSVVIATPGSQVELTIPTLSVTNKRGVSIVVYRTTANGTVYYRLNAPNDPLANIINADFVQYDDTVNDNLIIASEQLYTLGEVENIAAPSPDILAVFKNRVLLVPSENPYSFWYSKQVIPGSPVEFSDVFVQNVGTVGGKITALETMDDKIIIYNPTSIYFMVGTGPAASGANNDFSFPLAIATDCGAIDFTSIISMPLGHMFKSEKGIYLLDRSLQAKYIGSDVEEYNQYEVLTARLRDKENQVLFILSNGVTLMYDYFYGQWSVFTNTPGISDVLYKETHVYISSDGQVYRETPGQYLDGSDPILMYFLTGWLNFAGLQGYERAYFFYLLGQYLSPHSLSIGIAYDYDPTIVQTITINPDSAESIEQWRVFLDKQKCEAFQISFQEVYGGSPGAGFTLSGLDVTVGFKDGRPRLNANRSAS